MQWQGEKVQLVFFYFFHTYHAIYIRSQVKYGSLNSSNFPTTMWRLLLLISVCRWSHTKLLKCHATIPTTQMNYNYSSYFIKLIFLLFFFFVFFFVFFFFFFFCFFLFFFCCFFFCCCSPFIYSYLSFLYASFSAFFFLFHYSCFKTFRYVVSRLLWIFISM